MLIHPSSKVRRVNYFTCALLIVVDGPSCMQTFSVALQKKRTSVRRYGDCH